MSVDEHTDHKQVAKQSIVAAIVIGVAAFGFLIGTSSRDADTGHAVLSEMAASSEIDVRPGAAIAAPTYAGIRDVNGSANAYWTTAIPIPAGLRTPPDEHRANTGFDSQLAVLNERAELRAYEGAPPTIPHPIQESGLAECVACHRQGAEIGDRIAPVMSHAEYTNCTQCHVRAVPAHAELTAFTLSLENSFQGMLRAGTSTRAYEGAPPTVPHAIHMRGNCISCHGVRSHPALRTSHPERQNCVQCHVQTDISRGLEFPSQGGPPHRLMQRDTR